MKIESMIIDPVTNFGKVTVSTGYTSADTTIVLNTGQGTKLPDPSISGSFNLVWYNSTDYPDPSDDPSVEIVRCITRVTDTIVVMRAQEGMLASNKNLSGKTYKMVLSPTKKTITDIQTDISASVKKSGDTMTGTLNLPLNGLIVGTNQLIVSGGNVGIGTIGPTATLTVKGTGNGIIQMMQNPSFPDYFIISLNGTADNANYNITSSPIDKNLYFNRPTGQAIFFRENNTIDHLSIIPGGNVGIGTTSPGAKLDIHVNSTDTTFPWNSSHTRITNENVTNGIFSSIDFIHGTSINGSIALKKIFGNSSDFVFWTNNGTSLAEKMRITGGGDVGIGTDSPSQKLHVRGTGHINPIFETDQGNNIIRIMNVMNPISGTMRGLESYEGGIKRGHIINYSSNFGGYNDGWEVYMKSNFEWRSDTITYPNFIMRLTSNGNVGIGIPPTYQLQLSTDSAAKPGTNTWTISSDERIKKDIRPFIEGIETILNINPVWYKYNGKGGFKDDNKDHIGVIGQEIKDIAPYTINTYKVKLNEDDKEETELLNFNSHALTFVLINAIKDMKKEIESLKEEIKILNLKENCV